MSARTIQQKGPTLLPPPISKLGKYGLLFFFFKGILWLLGPWAIYAFQ